MTWQWLAVRHSTWGGGAVTRRVRRDLSMVFWAVAVGGQQQQRGARYWATSELSTLDLVVSRTGAGP
jgi:hypothetical protein